MTSTLQSFPNPVKNEVSLYIKSDRDEPMSLTIHDSNGVEILRNDNYRTNELIVIPNHWPAGVYIARVKYGDVIDERKILKME